MKKLENSMPHGRKNKLFLLLTGCCMASVLFLYACTGNNTPPSQNPAATMAAPFPSATAAVSAVQPASEPSAGATPSIAQPKTSASAPGISIPESGWETILVNPSHPLPAGFKVQLANFQGGQVDARILAVCEQMFGDAKKDGVTLSLVDAYRSHDRQSELYQQKVESYMAQGYGRSDAEAKAATITARPDTSEHQTGLALDIVTPTYTSRDKGFANTKAFEWLNANAQSYGFTLRYGQDKEEITKVIYEPWHWRYVGVKAAVGMKASGECYEEYVGELD